MKKTLFISISIMLFISASRCSDTSFGNDLWDNVTSSKITSDKQITSFSINGYKARITGTTVKSVLPYGASVTALTPVITHNGASISPESGTAQNFSSPVTYTVTATDGTTEKYTVTVTVLDASGMANADLSILLVKKGKLQPTFNAGVTNYLDAPIPFSDSANPAYNAKQSNSVIADPEILIATMTINGIAVENAEEYLISNLDVGPNNVEIKVTSADESNVNIYKVKMYRAIPIFKTGAGSYSGMNPLEDGATQRGVSWPYPRFTVSGTVVKDNMTGLIWLKEMKLNSLTYSFNDAVMNSNTISDNLVGEPLSYEWRLPNIRELRSIANYSMNANNGLNSFFNNYSTSDGWWTSTSSPSNPTNEAYILGIDNNSFSKKAKNTTPSPIYYAWPVRGDSKSIPKTGQTIQYFLDDDGKLQKGTEWPIPRFYKEASGTIVDNMTSLMWFPNANSTSRIWINSIDFIENTINPDSLGGNFGYSDWSLPNANELETLLNYGQSDLNFWLNSYGFTFDDYVSYWTSTSSNMTPTFNAIHIDFDLKTQLVWSKAMTYNVLPVRQARIINY